MRFINLILTNVNTYNMPYYKVTYNPTTHKKYIVVVNGISAETKHHAISLAIATEAGREYQDLKLYKAKLLK